MMCLPSRTYLLKTLGLITCECKIRVLVSILFTFKSTG